MADDDHGPLALQEILLAGCPTVGVRTGASFVRHGETLNVSGQLVDFAGDPILKAGLVAFLVTLFDEATETVINGVDQQDRLAEVTADGSFTLKLNGEDNVIVDLAGRQLGANREAHARDVLALERWKPGSVGDPAGPVPGSAAWCAGVSGVALTQRPIWRNAHRRRYNHGHGKCLLKETPMTDVTQILSQIGDGDPSAAEQLLPLVYKELKKLAAAKLANEKPGQTLQATALVHEAYNDARLITRTEAVRNAMWVIEMPPQRAQLAVRQSHL